MQIWGKNPKHNSIYFLKFLLIIFMALPIFSQELEIQEEYNQKYRPQFHYSPQTNWMNDPNGLVYFDGEYHLFYQYNPFGNTWGHMSWGHAVSTDLVHWKELGVAIPEEKGIMAFSGSAVVDKNNTTGFGKNGSTPIVAIYTGYRTSDKRQYQCLAYSLDHGRTWKKYKDNPVLDIKSKSFRDPHVFWYGPDHKWIMVIAFSDDKQIGFYSSKDLKDWNYLSKFGPAGETDGIWECPDLFPLPVNGYEDSVKWILEVDLGSNTVAGGSGGQYFIGEFDGQKFTRSSYNMDLLFSQAKIIEDFEAGNYNNWKIKGTAFGDKPAKYNPENQNTMEAFKNEYFINTSLKGDSLVGTAISPSFTISKQFINFLVGGGKFPEQTCVNLIIEDSTIYTTSGNNSNKLEWKNWNVSDYQNKVAQIKIIDAIKRNSGYISVDHIIQNSVALGKNGQPINWIDYGRDFYAAITYSNIPQSDGRTIWMGWMNNWDYAQKIPTSPWRSAQSIPRTLALRTINNELRLIQKPVVELKQLRNAHYHFSNSTIHTINSKIKEKGIAGKRFEILLQCNKIGNKKVGLKLRKGKQQETIICYNGKKNELLLDRRNSGKSDFHQNFSEIHRAPLKLTNGSLKLHIYLDHSSVEIFANHGSRVITDRIFPSAESDRIEFFSDNPHSFFIKALDLYELKSIWSK